LTVANGEYVTELQVRWSDCDPAGVAYYANYFSFYEAAVVAFMEERGTSWHTLLEAHGVRFPRVEARCRYLASVTFGDHIRVRFRVAELRARVATMRFWIDRVRDGAPAAEGEVVIVCLPRQRPGADVARAIELPTSFREAFGPLLPAPPGTQAP